MNRAWLAMVVVSVAIVGMACALFAGQTALAFIRDSEYTLSPGTSVEQDLYVEAAAIELNGDVEGDVETRSIYFKSLGTIVGGVEISSGLAELRGGIAGDVQIRAVEARIYGVIDGDLSFTGGQLTIMEGAAILGDIRVSGRGLVVTATSTIAGEVEARVDQLVIEGNVQGGVSATVRTMHITDGSVVNGGVSYRSITDAVIDPGAEINGPVQRTEFLSGVPGATALFWQTGWLAATAILAILGCALLFLGTQGGNGSGNRLAALVSTLPGLGLLGLLPIFLMVASMYVVTIPFVLLGLFGYVLLVGWSLAAGAFVVGGMLAPGRWSGSSIARLSIGIVCFALLYLVCPIPLLVPMFFAASGAGLLTRDRAPNSSGRGAGWPVFASNGALGFVATTLAIGALTIGAVASAATVVTLSESASLVWEYSPITFGIVAWVLATAALLVPVIAFEWTAVKRRRSG